MQELAIFLIFCLEGIVGIALLMAWKDVSSKRTALPSMTQEVYDELQKIATNTLDQAKDIIDQAHENYTNLSGSIETVTSSFLEESRQMREKFGSLENSLFKVGQSELKEEIGDIGKEATELMRSQITAQSQNLSTELEKMVGDLKNSLRTELAQVLESSRRQIRQETDQQMQQLAAQSEDLIAEVAGQILQDGLSMTEKHELTLRLLKEAWEKRRGATPTLSAPTAPKIDSKQNQESI